MKKITAKAQQPLELIRLLADKQNDISEAEGRVLISLVSNFFRAHMLAAEHPKDKVRAIMTKFRDAGRRSAPWKPTSSVVPGRPQDGKDGNRRARWLFEESHKYYATEISATLVEVKYYLQTLSMLGAPPLPKNTIQRSFDWLLKHPLEPGQYADPIQLIKMDVREFVADPRSVQSGHLVPLDRLGRHVPDNTFLMLSRSNQIQGNQTLDELLNLMRDIIKKHDDARPVADGLSAAMNRSD